LVSMRWLVLPWMGAYLVKADQPVKADIAVVLAGDHWGNRILRGAELQRDGLVDKVLVSGGPWVFGMNESDLAVRFAVARGFPADCFIVLHDEVHSTQEEAHSIAKELKSRGVKSAMVVTSDYHTRRAGWIWRHTAPWLEIHMVGAPDRYYRADHWWTDRESGKIVFSEWSKTIAYALDFFPPPNSGPVPQP